MYLTSPCAPLSGAPWWGVTPTTTTQAPSSWASRPLDDPTFRHDSTSECDVGLPFISLNSFVSHRSHPEGYTGRGA